VVLREGERKVLLVQHPDSTVAPQGEKLRVVSPAVPRSVPPAVQPAIAQDVRIGIEEEPARRGWEHSLGSEQLSASHKRTVRRRPRTGVAGNGRLSRSHEMRCQALPLRH
jgi:hypothetical protein